MAVIQPVYGLPGVRSALTANHRTIFLQSGPIVNLAGGKIINGTLTRDASNDDPTRIRAGKLMGKITATGLYRPSIIGLSNLAYADNDTTIQTSLAVATEVARLLAVAGGASVSLKFIGPPTAAGTVAATAITVTTVTLNGATSLLTVGDLNLNKVTGSIIAPADGAEVPIMVMPDGYPFAVTDADGVSQDQPYPEMPTWAVLESSKIIDWPADTSTRTYIKTSMNGAGGGQYSFSDIY